MRETTVQYLLEELPKLKKLFQREEKDNISLETMVLLATIVDQFQLLKEFLVMQEDRKK